MNDQVTRIGIRNSSSFRDTYCIIAARVRKIKCIRPSFAPVIRAGCMQRETRRIQLGGVLYLVAVPKAWSRTPETLVHTVPHSRGPTRHPVGLQPINNPPTVACASGAVHNSLPATLDEVAESDRYNHHDTRTNQREFSEEQ